jgi:calpain
LLGELRESGKLFEDPDFPANNNSLSHSGNIDGVIEWKRPHQLSTNPQFIENGISRFDVKQGALGDCWLMAAMAVLTQDMDLFHNVVCEDNGFDENYAGIFKFRFWQYGEWKTVIIDDRLPTRNGKLLYMSSSDENEFWGPLLEKAYAKLNGSYESLEGGHTTEAMEDFTGGISEMFLLNDVPYDFYDIIKTANSHRSLIGCGINYKHEEMDDIHGLVSGHAYSVTGLVVLPVKKMQVNLLRIRNPWGNATEWTGPWSDG